MEKLNEYELADIIINIPEHVKLMCVLTTQIRNAVTTHSILSQIKKYGLGSNLVDNAYETNNLQLLKYITSIGKDVSSDCAFETTVSNNNVECLKYAIEHECNISCISDLLCPSKFECFKCTFAYLNNALKNSLVDDPSSYVEYNDIDDIICEYMKQIFSDDLIKHCEFANEIGIKIDDYGIENAITENGTKCLRYLHDKGYELSDELFYEITGIEYTGSLIYLIEIGCVPDGEDMLSYMEWCNEKLLKYLYAHNCKLTQEMYDTLVMRGELPLSKYVHDIIGIDISNDMIDGSMKYCDVILLEYYERCGYKFTKKTCKMAITYGNLQCLKYIHSHGCTLNNNMMEDAISSDTFKCFRYLYSNGCEITDVAMNMMVQKDRIKMFEYIYDDYELESNTFDNVKSNNKCLSYAIKHKFPINDTTYKKIVNKCNEKLIKYLCECGYTLPINACDIFAKHNKISLLKYAISLGCKYTTDTIRIALENNSFTASDYLTQCMDTFDEKIFPKNTYSRDHIIKILSKTKKMCTHDTLKKIIEKNDSSILNLMIKLGQKITKELCDYVLQHGYHNCFNVLLENKYFEYVTDWKKYINDPTMQNMLNILCQFVDNILPDTVECDYTLDEYFSHLPTIVMTEPTKYIYTIKKFIISAKDKICIENVNPRDRKWIHHISYCLGLTSKSEEIPNYNDSDYDSMTDYNRYMKDIYLTKPIDWKLNLHEIITYAGLQKHNKNLK